jgi:hypothetical protein
MHLYYKGQLVNAVQGDYPCLFGESYETHKYAEGKMHNYWLLKQVAYDL